MRFFTLADNLFKINAAHNAYSPYSNMQSRQAGNSQGVNNAGNVGRVNPTSQSTSGTRSSFGSAQIQQPAGSESRHPSKQAITPTSMVGGSTGGQNSITDMMNAAFPSSNSLNNGLSPAKKGWIG